MAAVLLMLAMQAARPLSPIEDRPIVVTARRLQDTEAALAACHARGCPPAEDVSASLTHAENQFVAGDYDGARQTLRAALGRDRRFRRTEPVAVASLYRGRGNIELHRGKRDTYRLAQTDALDALRAGLAADDGRVLAQRIELADAYAHVADANHAVPQYRAVASSARKAGRRDLEARASLKLATMYSARAIADAAYDADARRALAVVAAFDDPAFAPFRFAAGCLGAVIDEAHGRVGALDRFLAAHRDQQMAVPVLLFVPPLDRFVAASSRYRVIGVTGALTSGISDVDQWIDLSYWIAPDGRVSDVGLLRHSARFAEYWADPVLRQVAARRYAPLALPADSPGILRVERVTRTADRQEMGKRGSIAHFEVLDLTADPAAGPALPRAAAPAVTPG